MKSYLILLLVLLSINIYGQSIKYPSWIKGIWFNKYESNTKKFIFWKFENDSIFYSHGQLSFIKSKSTCLNKKYSNYIFLSKADTNLFHFVLIRHSAANLGINYLIESTE